MSFLAYQFIIAGVLAGKFQFLRFPAPRGGETQCTYIPCCQKLCILIYEKLCTLIFYLQRVGIHSLRYILPCPHSFNVVVRKDR